MAEGTKWTEESAVAADEAISRLVIEEEACGRRLASNTVGNGD
jgi:hypothetical protein